MDPSAFVGFVAAIAGIAAFVTASMRRYNKQVGKDAVTAAQHTEIAQWFREDQDHDSLPTMVKQALQKLDAQTAQMIRQGEEIGQLHTRLSTHLVDEEAKVDVIAQRLAAGDQRMARIEEQLTETLEAVTSGNPEVRPSLRRSNGGWQG